MPTTDEMMQDEIGIFEGVDVEIDGEATAVMTAESLAKILTEERRIAHRLHAERHRRALNAQARPRSCRDTR
jgi:hypothetical protein